MSKSKKTEISEFNLSGRFLGFLTSDRLKPKYVRLTTSEGEQVIKLAKSLRASLSTDLLIGEELKVRVREAKDLAKGKLKLKAHAVERLKSNITEPSFGKNLELIPRFTEPTSAPKNSIITVLVCQKSNCLKKGSDKICEALAAELGDRQLEQNVKVKSTGCLKNCKQGPNLVVLPNKKRYIHVQTGQVPEIVESISQVLDSFSCLSAKP